MDIKRGDDLFQKVGKKDQSTAAEGAAKPNQHRTVLLLGKKLTML